MNKKIYTTFNIALLFFITAGCSSNSNYKFSKRDTLQFVFFNQIKDAYPVRLFKYFKEHKIKTISFVSKNLNTNKLDSLAYLEIDKTGKLSTRTTKECTTIGCLPYMNRQEYLYSNNKIERIDVYIFKKHSQPILSKWLNPDTSEYYKFDWNTYSYKGDTVFVETAVALYKYIKNYSNNIIYRSLRVKSTNQIVHTNFSYTDSTISSKSKFNFGDDTTLTYKYKIKDNHVEGWSLNNNIPKLFKEWVFDSTGLVNKIYIYENGKIVSIIKLTYTFYS